MGLARIFEGGVIFKVVTNLRVPIYVWHSYICGECDDAS